MEDNNKYNFKEWVINNLWYKPTGDDFKVKNNLKGKALLDHDFLADVDVNHIEGYHLWNGKKLFSISRLLKPVTEAKLIHVPPLTLQKARDLGTSLMTNLEYWWTNNIKNIENMPMMTPDERTMFIDFVKFFKENRITIKAVEKFVRVGLWCGYIDVVARFNKWIVNLEIKTRSNLQVRDSDLIQANHYYNMTGIPTILIIYDKNKREFALHKIFRQKKIKPSCQLCVSTFNKHLTPFGFPKLMSLNYEQKINETTGKKYYIITNLQDYK